MQEHDTSRGTPGIGAAAHPGRIDSIDQVRGAAMVLMALDHVRFFLTDVTGYQPETLAQTNLWLFLTRWVTHFCAPAFFLLAGIAISLYAGKVGSTGALRRFLVSRGVLLVVLEFTVVGYAWVFTPGFSFGGVIWSLGCSMIVMAALATIPRGILLAGSSLFLVLHNPLLDDLAGPASGWPGFLWSMLYRPGSVEIPLTGGDYFFLFPVVPWLAMMVAGYALGPVFARPPAARKRLLAGAGGAMVLGFVALRLAGNFGNPETLWISPDTHGAFAAQPGLSATVVSFLNTEKYPPSLQFTLMTLGPILLWLGLSRADRPARRRNIFGEVLVLFGRVPLFFYLCHLYLIHLLALAATGLAGQPNAWIGFGADPAASRPDGFGFGLAGVYVAWAVVTAALYVMCAHYERFKRTHSHAWLRYI